MEDCGFNSCYKGTIVGKSKNRFVVGYGVIIYHFGLANPYKKDDAQQLRFKEDFLLFVAKTYMPISIVES
jgi:hypothetical protein